MQGQHLQPLLHWLMVSGGQWRPVAMVLTITNEVMAPIMNMNARTVPASTVAMTKDSSHSHNNNNDNECSDGTNNDNNKCKKEGEMRG